MTPQAGTVADIVARLQAAQALVGFDRGAHSYRIDGQLYTSVTTALAILDKPALKFWAANVQQEADLAAIEGWLDGGQSGPLKDELDKVKHAFRRISRQAKDIGTEAHDMIEFLLRQRLKPTGAEAPKISMDAQYVVSAWKRWAAEAGFEPLSIESMIFSKPNRVAGKFDCFAKLTKHPLFAGRLTLTDWKSAKALYEEHVLQAVAYHGIFAEMMGIDPKEIVSLLVRLPKDQPDEPEMRIVEWDPKAYEAFLGLLPMYRWRKGA